MAFADPWDLTTPADTDWASEGDDRIRELKRALDERLSTLIENWADGDLKLIASKLNATPTAGATIAYGTAVNLPNPAATDFYYATDTDDLYVKNGTVFNLIHQGSSGSTGGGGAVFTAVYDGSKPIQSRVSGGVNAAKLTSVLATVTSDGSGFVWFSLDDITVARLDVFHATVDVVAVGGAIPNAAAMVVAVLAGLPPLEPAGIVKILIHEHGNVGTPITNFTLPLVVNIYSKAAA